MAGVAMTLDLASFFQDMSKFTMDGFDLAAEMGQNKSDGDSPEVVLDFILISS